MYVCMYLCLYLCMYVYMCMCIYHMYHAGLQMRDGEQSIVAKFWPLSTHIYHLIIIDQWIFQEVFLLVIIIVIYKRFFWTILNLFSWNLNIYKTHRKSVLFPFFCYTDSQTELIRLFNFFTREAFKLIKCIVLYKILLWGIQPFRTIFQRI